MIQSAHIVKAFQKFKTDKSTSHGYEKGYEYIFKRLVPASLLEIGIKRGSSLAAWRELFPECQITGVDITEKWFDKQFLDFAKSKIVICDSTKPIVLSHLESTYDIIIDDGSHFYNDIFSTFDLLKERFNYFYVVEDSMYFTDSLVNYIINLGFIVKRFPSKVLNVDVNFNILTKGEKYITKTKDTNLAKHLTDNVSLEMLVIEKKPL